MENYQLGVQGGQATMGYNEKIALHAQQQAALAREQPQTIMAAIGYELDGMTNTASANLAQLQDFAARIFGSIPTPESAKPSPPRPVPNGAAQALVEKIDMLKEILCRQMEAIQQLQKIA